MCPALSLPFFNANRITKIKDFNEKTFLVNESQENVVISNKIHVLKYSSFSIFKTVS